MCTSTKERKTKKATSSTWYKKQETKGRARSSEYPNTKIWRKKLHENISAVSRIRIYSANCKLISKV